MPTGLKYPFYIAGIRHAKPVSISP